MTGAIEELDTVEPLQARMARHTFDRLIMLSDGVFAIAITLAALEIRPPAGWTDLKGLVDQLRFPFMAYVISFAVVASYWSSQRELIGRLVRVDRPFIFLALTQLLCVALIPSATQLLYRHGPDTQAVQVYGAVLAACGYISAAMWAYGLCRPGLAHPENNMRFRIVRIVLALIVPATFTWVAATGGSLTSGPIVAVVALGLTRRFLLVRVDQGRPWGLRKQP